MIMKRPRPALGFILAGALLPAVAAHAGGADGPPRCQYVEVAHMPMRYAGTGLAPAVDGSINRTPATLLVNTGSFDTQLTMNGVNKRDMGLQMTNGYVEGVGGYSRLYSARVHEMSLGPVKSTHTRYLPVIGDANLTPAFDAIVGAPFLLQADLEFDLPAKQLRFFRPLDCGHTDLTIWKEDTVILPFDYNSDSSPNPHFTVTVNGVKLDAVIATGVQTSVILRRAAKRAGIDTDGPDARRQGNAVGIGTDPAPMWRAIFKSVEIGGEAIHNADLGIMDAQSELGTDMLLGQDFLRTHRVLFAMSQRKLYIAYLGGSPFGRTTGVEPWMRAEAEAGNPDAQFVLATVYRNGRGVERDLPQARAWLDKAATGGEPHAKLQLGRQQLEAGHLPEAIAQLRAGLDLLPADRFGPLWLYVARVRNGEPDLARSELQASLKKQQDDNWPAPIAAFYLGKLDAAGLLDAAGKERKSAHARSCQADGYMAEWYGARGDQAQADSLRATMRAHCTTPAPAANKERTS